MSVSCDGPADIYNEHRLKTRKAHRCDACRIDVAPGEHYTKVSILHDGSWATHRRCDRCQATHLHLRTLCEPVGLWPEERLDCGMSYDEEWGTLPPEIATLPFVDADNAALILELVTAQRELDLRNRCAKSAEVCMERCQEGRKRDPVFYTPERWADAQRHAAKSIRHRREAQRLVDELRATVRERIL